MRLAASHTPALHWPCRLDDSFPLFTPLNLLPGLGQVWGRPPRTELRQWKTRTEATSMSPGKKPASLGQGCHCEALLTTIIGMWLLTDGETEAQKDESAQACLWEVPSHLSRSHDPSGSHTGQGMVGHTQAPTPHPHPDPSSSLFAHVYVCCGHVFSCVCAHTRVCAHVCEDQRLIRASPSMSTLLPRQGVSR